MDAQELRQLSRIEIQKLAKVHGLKANLKSASIIAQLVALLPTGVPRLPRAPSPTASETGQKPAEQKQKQSRAGRTPGVATRRSARLQPRPPADEDPSPTETHPHPRARRTTPRAKPPPPPSPPRAETPQTTIKQESRSDTAASRGVRWAPSPGTRVAEWRERLYAGGGPAPSPEPIADPDAAPLDPTTETRITRAQAEFVAGELGEMRAAGAVARRVREVRGVVAGIAAAVGEVRAEGGAGARMRMGMRGVLEGALAAQALARERREGLRGARGGARGGPRGQAGAQRETQARARGEGSKRKRRIEEDEDEDEDEAAHRASRSRSRAGELWASSPSGSVEV
ncbi:hypothetical protein HETIRDRAFT_431105 [Heterobasidion irregulare TC 32-1]|uniref:Uncharacterized protein n=1 Tax=Heterobasidion irregulare (strain TC 32-1) TaxID=747525 RepID=W4JMX9_HETIT|nr:uncharacterized protein HETIRDRAFT_431105 [Heterobasidion irregulare TC 32-1]ETW74912.1 hypothetical protein HETIRDRAFT_431105 [Heterobasidion irregulare TC 32-1]